MMFSEEAVKIFDSGYNCAQAVLLAFSEKFNIDKDSAVKIASGFGGGMARMQETCGAVTGGIMIAGLAFTNIMEDNATNKERVYYIISQFIMRFKEKYGTIKCSELLNCDRNTEEGQRYYEKNNLQQNICRNCVEDVTRLLDDLTKKYNQ